MYLALIRQSGEGCDYTIGCGVTWKFIGTDDINKAQEELRDILLGNGEESGLISSAGGFSTVVLLRVNEIHDINTQSIDLEYEKILEDREKEKERKEYERLKQKFG